MPQHRLGGEAERGLINADPKPLLSFTMVLGAGFFADRNIAASAALTALINLAHVLPQALILCTLRTLSFVITTLYLG